MNIKTVLNLGRKVMLTAKARGYSNISVKLKQLMGIDCEISQQTLATRLVHNVPFVRVLVFRIQEV